MKIDTSFLQVLKTKLDRVIDLNACNTANKRAIRQSMLLMSHPLFDKHHYLKQAAATRRPVGPMPPSLHYVKTGDAKRINPHPLFDNHFYHELYHDVEGSGTTALYHYIEHGSQEGRSPHPLFDTVYVQDQITDNSNPLLAYINAEPGTLKPHPLFDEHHVIQQIGSIKDRYRTVLEAYLAAPLSVTPSDNFDPHEYACQYPSIGNMHPFYHYVRWGRNEGRQSFGRASSIHGIKKAIEAAAALDPAILPPSADYNEFERINRAVAAPQPERLMIRLLRNIKQNQTTYIYLLNDLLVNGSGRVTSNLCHAQRTDPDIEQIIIITTGRGVDAETQNWFPKQQFTVISIADIVESAGKYESALVIATFVQLLQLKGICVINSELGWILIERHGKALQQLCPVSAGVFCYDYDEYNRRCGHAWTSLPYAINRLDCIFTDNANFIETLMRDLNLSNDARKRFAVFYQPSTTPEIECLRNRLEIAPHRVLWASRFSAQKRVRLAVQVAKLLPEFDFMIAGGHLADSQLQGVPLAANISLLGPFSKFTELYTYSCSVFLYTSRWDGLPNILLEAGASGMPIIAPNVGGIRELIDTSTGWLIDDHSNPHAYARAVEECLRNRNEAFNRSSRLLERIRERHSPSSFSKSISILKR